MNNQASGVPEQPFPLAWFGAHPVSAHAVPSDWFKISVDGGQVTQVTDVRDVGLIGAFSPDGQWLAFISQKGVFVVRPDGSKLTQVASGMAMGSVSWLL